jgi:putative endonuclease
MTWNVILMLIIKKSVTLNLFQGPFHGITRKMREEKQPCVYILASKLYGSLYIGVTSDLMQRLNQHRNNLTPGHTSKYAIYRLVHYELFGEMEPAILREKQLKNWHRQWKINLINANNPHWEDMAVGLGLSPIASGVRRDGP